MKNQLLNKTMGIKMNTKIAWIDQNERFGLDYSTRKGTCKDFGFDIRYDYDDGGNGDLHTKPDCGMCLVMSFMGVNIINKFGDLEGLTKWAEDFMLNHSKQY